MPTMLITGAGRGIGLEFVRQYAADGWRVHAACRDPAGARDLAGVKGDLRRHSLDVTDHAAIDSLALALAGEAIDLLVNNAGIYGPRPAQLGTVDYDAWGEVMRVNVMAPMRMAESFVDHVAASDRKLVVTISSAMGSIGDNRSGGSYIYRSSKAAVNAVMKNLSVELAPRGITVVVFHPGWVRTDMGGAGASLDASRSIAGMRRVIAGLGSGDTGRFLGHDGSELPW